MAKDLRPRSLRPFKIGWFHLGEDVEKSVPNRGLPDDAPRVLAQLAARPSFLMVGSIESRKGQTQPFAAFEKLWEEGLDATSSLSASRAGMWKSWQNSYATT